MIGMVLSSPLWLIPVWPIVRRGTPFMSVGKPYFFMKNLACSSSMSGKAILRTKTARSIGKSIGNSFCLHICVFHVSAWGRTFFGPKPCGRGIRDIDRGQQAPDNSTLRLTAPSFQLTSARLSNRMCARFGSKVQLGDVAARSPLCISFGPA